MEEGGAEWKKAALKWKKAPKFPSGPLRKVRVLYFFFGF